ncbi:MAG: hypothetical protein LBI54_08245 [Lachnospiraceae bacterium]|jgi:hypothetical protein|nr:hypothetical protein [Lachnospiraceae bacterium]
MTNLFWQIYKNLENEIIDLTENIYFDDTQIDTYSIKNVELLMRCAIEIEAISKELYRQMGGAIDADGKKTVTKPDGSVETEFVKYDFDCLKLLDVKWKLSKKQIIVFSSKMYFVKDENKILHPLKNAHKGEQKWQKRYQGVKHNRNAELKSATIRSLLKAMGALYILNLYYRNEDFYVNSIDDIDYTFGSKIFACSKGSDEKSVYVIERRQEHKQELENIVGGMPDISDYDKFIDYNEGLDQSKMTVYFCHLNKYTDGVL